MAATPRLPALKSSVFHGRLRLQSFLFRRRSVGNWVVIGIFLLFMAGTVLLYSEAVDPVADFWFKPHVEADSGTYWVLAGVRQSASLEETDSSGPQYGGGSWGPVLQAKIFRTDLGVFTTNLAMLGATLWLIQSMGEYDLSVFLLLLLINPLLFSALATLNKEIFAVFGLVLFLRGMAIEKHRGLFFLLGIVFSVGGHWQQGATLILLAVLLMRPSPVRKRPIAMLLTILFLFTIGYTAVYKLAPVVIAGLLAQAEAGHLIVLLDNIQGNFGFPLVFIPKLVMNVVGNFITPAYFFGEYWHTDFGNWYDQFFNEAQMVLTTLLLFAMVIARKLPLKEPLVQLLIVYFMLTAINPMVQPRYEYPAYVLLALQASRYFRLGLAPQSAQGQHPALLQ